jgi:hypothetical protein
MIICDNPNRKVNLETRSQRDRDYIPDYSGRWDYDKVRCRFAFQF